MKTTPDPRSSRRQLLQSLAVAPMPARMVGGGAALFLSPGASMLAATPACGAAVASTPPQTEGPYFTRNSPLRVSLVETGIPGAKLVLSGQVLSLDCRPLPGVLLDFWQADSEGEYDNRGYRLRGHQFTDADGRYRLETVVPGIYPGRTRHIHVKVQAPKGPVLTTQLYFPGEARNRNDGLFAAALLVRIPDAASASWARDSTRRDASEPAHASFDFAIRTA